MWSWGVPKNSSDQEASKLVLHLMPILTFLKSGDFSGHLKEVMGVRGQPGVICGPKGCQWTPLTQLLPNWCHTWCLTCNRVFQIFSCFLFCFLHFSICFKTKMINAHSKSPHQKLCNSPTIEMFLYWFCSLLKKIVFHDFFKPKQKKCGNPKNKMTIQIVDQFWLGSFGLAQQVLTLVQHM